MATFDFQDSAGKEVEISYPISTHLRFFDPDQSERRSIRILSVRDLLTDPLTLAEFNRRPWLMRSRWLATAFEPSRGQYRQFYVGSSREYRSPGVLRVAIYEHGSTRPDKFLGRAFQPTIEDRRVLIAAIREWSKHRHVLGSLRIVADGLGICCKSG
jgi:hypothetical protein